MHTKSVLVFSEDNYVEWPEDQQIETVGAIASINLSGNCAYYSLQGKARLEIGREEYRDICLNAGDANIVIEDRDLYIISGSAYHNGRKILTQSIRFDDGDSILIDTIRLSIVGDTLIIEGDGYVCSLQSTASPDARFEGFPTYKRSPRIIKRVPDTQVQFPKLPVFEKQKKGQLVKLILPPLITISMTIITSIFMPRGIYVIISAATMVASIVMSVSNFISERKERQKTEAESIEKFETDLLATRKKLNSLYSEQSEALLYHYPDIYEIAEQTRQYSDRIYEISANDGDFLTLSVGSASIPLSSAVKFCEGEITHENRIYSDQAKEVESRFSHVDNMPVVIDLKRAHLGLVGAPRGVHEQIKNIIAQLAFKTSYHDIQLICLFNEKYAAEFDYLKWYPHCKVSTINVTGVITTDNVRDQVLGHINRVIKERKLRSEKQNKQGAYLPHFIFIIDEPKLILNHSIMEYLQQKENTLGFSIIYATHLLSSLPENIQTVLEIKNSSAGNLLLNEGRLINQTLDLYKIDETKVNLENIARGMACLNHVQGISTQIPESITFFEMYGIKHPEELGVAKRWNNNLSHKSLAVLLGARADKDYVYLNLHEKAHGPHGLVAGTTGSGKSEIIQSYILSLAVNFHPYEVGFLLIDYKGGGMAGLFKDLPHLLGTITNLDGSESMRAMASIKSELARRQHIFSQNEVNHINQYNRLFRSGEVDKPLPHLFLISDEFAELKKEQPEFMKELVSAARIGRSLGIHLILATQKPSGVVDDQIWSNSKFKLALKVQDESDSNEVLKTPDAAGITQPGRAYLQVGNNEIYELFQSAWSGAAYSEEMENRGFDDRVYVLNALGQGMLLNHDLSDDSAVRESNTTQLDAVVEHVRRVFLGLGQAPVERPWLPSLGPKIVSPHIDASSLGDLAKISTLDACVKLGMIDIPEEQRQTEYEHDFTKDGNLAVFSSSGFGKSTTLMTMALSLAVKNSPEMLHFNVLDFGNSSLIQLQSLPHTADYFTFDQAEKLAKYSRNMDAELMRRKALFAKYSAFNFTMYNERANEKLPLIVNIIDNYDVLRELGQEFDEFITRLTRDGIGLGVYVVISASRPTAVKYAVLNNFKNRVAQFMFDQSDISTIVGRPPYPLPELQGRAFIKRQKAVNIMQIYTAVPFETDIEYADNIELVISKLSESYSGMKPEGVRMLPELVSTELLLDYAKGLSKSLLPIGLDTEEIEPQGITLTEPVNLIVGPAKSGKTNVVKLALVSLVGSSKVFIVDSKEMSLLSYRNAHADARYVSDAESMAQAIEELGEIVEVRKTGLLEAQKEQPTLFPRAYYTSLPKVCVVMDDADYFIDLLKPIKEAEAILSDCLQVGVNFIVATASTKMKGYDNVTKLLKETQSGIVLGIPNEQNFLPSPILRGIRRQVDTGFVYRNGELTQIKIPIAPSGE